MVVCDWLKGFVYSVYVRSAGANRSEVNMDEVILFTLNPVDK